jgi:hypothetical protein
LGVSVKELGERLGRIPILSVFASPIIWAGKQFRNHYLIFTIGDLG